MLYECSILVGIFRTNYEHFRNVQALTFLECSYLMSYECSILIGMSCTKNEHSCNLQVAYINKVGNEFSWFGWPDWPGNVRAQFFGRSGKVLHWTFSIVGMAFQYQNVNNGIPDDRVARSTNSFVTTNERSLFDLFTALWMHATNQPHGGFCQM